MTAEGAELGSMKIDRLTRRFAVLFVRIRKIDVLGPDGELLTSIQGSSLPAPTGDLVPPSKPQLPAPAIRPTPGARSTDSEMRERIDTIADDLRRKSEIELKKAKCKSRAMKVNPDEKAPAHQQELEACMKEG
jgi:hypothetical protein